MHEPLARAFAFDEDVAIIGITGEAVALSSRRRPGVDAFLVFANFQDGGSYTSPVIVDILFGPNGENVAQSTFTAKLNGVDVSSQFLVLEPNRRRAVFQITSGSPLLAGKNVLITAVDGIARSSGQTATDSDRLVFLAQ